MTITPVTNDVEHKAALHRIDHLLGAAEGSDARKELEAMLTLVEAYEVRRWPLDETIDPINLLKQAMSEEVGHSRAQLVEIVGSASRVSELLSKKRRLTLDHIRAISAAWAIPLALLAAPYALAEDDAPSQRRRA